MFTVYMFKAGAVKICCILSIFDLLWTHQIVVLHLNYDEITNTVVQIVFYKSIIYNGEYYDQEPPILRLLVQSQQFGDILVFSHTSAKAEHD